METIDSIQGGFFAEKIKVQADCFWMESCLPPADQFQYHNEKLAFIDIFRYHN